MLEKISTNKVQNSDYNGTIVCLCRFFHKNRIYPLSFSVGGVASVSDGTSRTDVVASQA